MTKKRYVGYAWESRDQTTPVFDAKGIETVRRDTCPLVNKVRAQLAVAQMSRCLTNAFVYSSTMLAL
jgi:DNA polymerase elongation subunit (family B)